MGENEIKIAKLEANMEQVQKDTAEIKDLKEAVIKLTYIVEELKREKEEAAHAEPAKVSFWDSKAGEKIPLYITILAGITIAALTGERMIEVFKVIPIQ